MGILRRKKESGKMKKEGQRGQNEGGAEKHSLFLLTWRFTLSSFYVFLFLHLFSLSTLSLSEVNRYNSLKLNFSANLKLYTVVPILERVPLPGKIQISGFIFLINWPSISFELQAAAPEETELWNLQISEVPVAQQNKGGEEVKRAWKKAAKE